MKLKIAKSNLLDVVIIWFLLLHVFVFRWMGQTKPFVYIVLILFILKFIKILPEIVRMTSTYYLLLTMSYPIFSFYKSGGNIHYALANLYNIALPMLTLFYFSYLLKRKPDFIRNFLIELCKIFNFYFIFNTIILILQAAGVALFIVVKIEGPIIIEDQICGLFGVNGTHCLTYFASFLIIYNYLYYKYYLKKYRKAFCFYNLFLVFFNFAISFWNDNKGFYLVFATEVFLAYVVGLLAKYNYKSILLSVVKVIRKILLFVVLGLVVVIVLINYTKMGRYWEMILHEMDNGINKGNLVQGSSERIGMIMYILNARDSRLFGFGIGNYVWTSNGAFGFNHYGQSDLGTFIMLGGVLFVIILGLFLYSSIKESIKNVAIVLMTLIFFMVSAIYTQIFTTPSIIISAMLFLGTIFSMSQISSSKLMGY